MKRTVLVLGLAFGFVTALAPDLRSAVEPFSHHGTKCWRGSSAFEWRLCRGESTA